MLHSVQLRAIQFLSLGRNFCDTATACKISRSTLGRWKQKPEFKKLLEHELAGLQSNMHGQVQTLARESVDGMLDANRELRAVLLHDRTNPNIKCTASTAVLRFGSRWLDLLGYTLKADSPQKLYADKPQPVPEAQPESTPAPAPAPESEPEPEDELELESVEQYANSAVLPRKREARPGSEIDPLPPIFGANFTNDIEHYRKAQLSAPECNSDYEDNRGGPNGPSGAIDPDARPRPIDFTDEAHADDADSDGSEASAKDECECEVTAEQPGASAKDECECEVTEEQPGPSEADESTAAPIQTSPPDG